MKPMKPAFGINEFLFASPDIRWSEVGLYKIFVTMLPTNQGYQGDMDIGLNSQFSHLLISVIFLAHDEVSMSRSRIYSQLLSISQFSYSPHRNLLLLNEKSPFTFLNSQNKYQSDFFKTGL